jgi:lipopolysaccharide/colanic/teichoic acid biosynthesis glycosyltransferase
MRDRVAESALSHLYNLMFSGIQFIDLYRIYEEVFDRVPISLVTYNWFLEHISLTPELGYGSIKRAFDVVASIILLIVLLPLYPFVALAIYLDSGRPIFYRAERLGEYNRVIHIPKFRTMVRCDTPDETVNTTNKVTRVGAFLRKTRIDEIPQLWSVIKGDLSLIGPRPEVPNIARVYEDKIPYYSMRHLVRPGLSGWAQLYGDHAHHGIGVDETRDKLSYDLYYLKNRSLIVDIKIALKTLKKIVTRSGA